VRPVSVLPIPPPLSAKHLHPSAISPHHRVHTVDEALKLNIEDKEESSPRRPSAKRVLPADEEQAPAAASAKSAPEGAGRPKRKAAPAPATETLVKSRGKKVNLILLLRSYRRVRREILRKKQAPATTRQLRISRRRMRWTRSLMSPQRTAQQCQAKVRNSLLVPPKTPLLCVRLSDVAPPSPPLGVEEAPSETGPNYNLPGASKMVLACSKQAVTNSVRRFTQASCPNSAPFPPIRHRVTEPFQRPAFRAPPLLWCAITRIDHPPVRCHCMSAARYKHNGLSKGNNDRQLGPISVYLNYRLDVRKYIFLVRSLLIFSLELYVPFDQVQCMWLRRAARFGWARDAIQPEMLWPGWDPAYSNGTRTRGSQEPYWIERSGGAGAGLCAPNPFNARVMITCGCCSSNPFTALRHV
jgi:hypothetical protein